MLMVDMKRRQQLANKSKITEELKDKVVMQYNDGHSIDDITKDCKISRASVYKIIKERTPQS